MDFYECCGLTNKYIYPTYYYKLTGYLKDHFFLNHFQNQDEAADFNALKIYILICMIFISMAMMFYGLILFKLRKTSEEEEAVMNFNTKDILLSDLIIKWDRIIFIIYLTIFILFNASYFVIYAIQNIGFLLLL